MIAAPLAFGAVGLGLLVYGARPPTSTCSPSASRPPRWSRDGARHADLRRERRDAAHLARRGADRRAHRPRQPPRADPRARRALPRRPAGAPLVLALFDLDGFKQYNDTFGHPAGDTLLVRLGGNLRGLPARPRPRLPDGRRRVLRAVRSRRRAARPTVSRRRAALSEQGDGFSITCSHGAIMLPLEADEPARRCGSPTSACTPTSTPAARRRAARARTSCCARSPSATRALAATPSGRPGRRHRARPRAEPRRDREVRHASELHDVGRLVLAPRTTSPSRASASCPPPPLSPPWPGSCVRSIRTTRRWAPRSWLQRPSTAWTARTRASTRPWSKQYSPPSPRPLPIRPRHRGPRTHDAQADGLAVACGPRNHGSPWSFSGPGRRPSASTRPRTGTPRLARDPQPQPEAPAIAAELGDALQLAFGAVARVARTVSSDRSGTPPASTILPPGGSPVPSSRSRPQNRIRPAPRSTPSPPGSRRSRACAATPRADASGRRSCPGTRC